MSPTPAYWPDRLPLRPHFRFFSGGNDNVREVMESFRLACERLGYSTSVETVPDVANTDINILFFAMGVNWPDEVPLPLNCLVVNFEPQLHLLTQRQPGYLHLLQRCYVWDYSEENLNHHARLGIGPSDVVPLTLEPHATPLLPAAALVPPEQRDVDVVFFGETTPRRLQLLQQLKDRGLSVVYPFGQPWTPAERDAWIARAKVALNVCKDEGSLTMEFPRLSILLRQRAAVISEAGTHTVAPTAVRRAIHTCAYAELVDATVALVADPQRCQRMREAAPAALQALPAQHEVLQHALGRYLDWIHQRLVTGTVPGLTTVEPTVSVLMVADDKAIGALENSLHSLARQTLLPLELVIVVQGQTGVLQDARLATALQTLRDQGVTVLSASIGATTGWATAASVGMGMASGHCLALWQPGHTAHPDRLRLQAGFLQLSPQHAVVGAWHATAPDEEAQHLPERHHEILARLLGHRAIQAPLHGPGLMLHLQRIRDRRLGLDTGLGDFAWLGLVLDLVGEGWRIANLKKTLCYTGSAPTPPVDEAAAKQLMRVQGRLLSLLFPERTRRQLQPLLQLHAWQWVAEAQSAWSMLEAMVAAVDSLPKADSPQTHWVAEVLRQEALRVLSVYRHSGLLTAAALLEALRQNEALQAWLAPLGDALALPA